MDANGDTPRIGENVSKGQPFEQRLLTHVLTRLSEELNGALRSAVSDANRGELSRDQYHELLILCQDLGDVLEFLDEYTYLKQQEVDDAPQ